MEPFLLYALLGGLFTWGLTAVGAASVFFAREPSRKLLDGMLGFAAGVMLAASVFSLLLPGMEMAEAQGKKSHSPRGGRVPPGRGAYPAFGPLPAPRPPGP